MRTTLGLAGALLVAAASVADAKTTQFWNLTANTIVSLQLSPTGQSVWGPDQTANDNDHAVDHDERLRIDGVQTGVYDVRFKDKTGRVCTVSKIEVRKDAVFTISEKQLAGCTH